MGKAKKKVEKRLPPLTRNRVMYRSQEEVDRVLNWADDALESGTRYHGETFEAGVAQGIRWVIGDSNEPPDSDD